MNDPRNSSKIDSIGPNPGMVMDEKEANAKYLLPAEQQVPKGYKQTEVGVIPEDWKVVRVGQYLNGSPSYGINAPAVPFDSRLYKYLSVKPVFSMMREPTSRTTAFNEKCLKTIA